MATVRGFIHSECEDYINFELELDLTSEEFDYLSVKEQDELIIDSYNEQSDAEISYDYEVFVEEIES